MGTFARMATSIDPSAFIRKFGRQPAGAVQAPGRVNLIGEHTDYNDGFVLPIAISRRTIALYAPRKDRTVRFSSLQADEDATVDLDRPITPDKPSWANYCRGVLSGLIEQGLARRGADILFDSTVPVGGGVSSSASLEVATALAVMHSTGQAGLVGGRRLALLCQQAEHRFAGAPCGIMDQSIVILAKEGMAMLLDCRDGAVRHVRFDDPSVVVLVVDTRVKHAISDGGYAVRREQCFRAAEALGVPALRDADRAMITSAADKGVLAGKELARARHVVGEIDRTVQAVETLERRDYRRFGELMYASHASLRDDYEVSCAELDAVVNTAAELDGVYGARMTGGGFGGCAIVLVTADRSDRTGTEIARAYTKRFGLDCSIFTTTASAGASAVQLRI